jgi:hypothetical protein
MPCSSGRELKQTLVNATNEMAAASEAMSDPSTPRSQRERRLQNAKNNHAWASTTLREHLERCAACRERALRPVYRETLPIHKHT